jgi:hypothetical protein
LADSALGETAAAAPLVRQAARILPRNWSTSARSRRRASMATDHPDPDRYI